MSILDFFRKLLKRPEVSEESETQQNQPQEEPKKPEERFILCIDGGGMRGIIPVVLLQQLEKSIRENGGDKDISSFFDLIAGTSTGGLIALALSCDSTLEHKACADTKQVSLEKLLESYMTMGEEIFQAKASLFGIRQIADNKYHSSGIQNYAKRLFGDLTMNQAKVPTLIMAYDLSTGSDQMIRSYGDEGLYPAWVAARATSAAPTYFEPYEYEGKLLADGGVIANNPVIYAYFEAKKLYPECEKFHILSVSTGGTYHTMVKDDTYGLISWGNQVVPMYGTAQKRTSDYVLNNIKDAEYLRLDEPLPETVKMDETNQAVLRMVCGHAYEGAMKHQSEINDFAASLVKNMENKDASETGRA